MPEKIVQTDKKISRLINILLVIDYLFVFSYFINRINIWLVGVQIKTKY